MKAMLPTQPYPENYLLALQAEAANEPEFDPESVGDPDKDAGYCEERYTYPCHVLLWSRYSPFYYATREEVSL